MNQTQSHSAPAPGVSRAALKLAVEAIEKFELIQPGDRIAVGMSGGKDSALLYLVLASVQQRSDYDFSLHPIHLDQHQPGFDQETFQEQLRLLGADLEVISEDTHSVVQANLKPGQIPCAICGRMRRGILNRFCMERGYNKLALGHHLDDAIETFFLNLLFGRRMDPLKPATPASDVDVTTIRPLILVEERKVLGWAVQEEIPVVACPVCDTVPESRRRDLKQLLAQFSAMQQDVHASMRAALYTGADGMTLIDRVDSY